MLSLNKMIRVSVFSLLLTQGGYSAEIPQQQFVGSSNTYQQEQVISLGETNSSETFDYLSHSTVIGPPNGTYLTISSLGLPKISIVTLLAYSTVFLLAGFNLLA